eukprot:m.309394 g.309394  ORF g.309394 m.309394 type:complete len:65 (-) comp22951_c0_seq1:36-230(-)
MEEERIKKNLTKKHDSEDIKREQQSAAAYAQQQTMRVWVQMELAKQLQLQWMRVAGGGLQIEVH